MKKENITNFSSTFLKIAKPKSDPPSRMTSTKATSLNVVP